MTAQHGDASSGDDDQLGGARPEGARPRLALGVAGAIGPRAAARIASAAEAAGFRTLWINETPGTNALEAAAGAAHATSGLRVATGVIALDRRGADEIAREAERLGIPQDRLAVGVGSGQVRRGALELVRSSVATLRERLTARVVVGALGPRMRELAAREADGVVLNWLPPEAAAGEADEHHAIDPAGDAVLYVRTTADAAAGGRLREEAARYGSLPAYAANFARLGCEPLDTVLEELAVDAGGDARRRLSAYAAAVDEVVLRAITAGGDADDLMRFVDAVAPVVRAIAEGPQKSR